MHYVYFVSLPRDGAETPEEAIDAAEMFLDGNNFVSGDGMWGEGKCDWYEIGGRWSGLFTELLMPAHLREAYRADINAIEERHAEAWKAASGKAPGPEWDKERERIDATCEQEIMAAWKKHFPDSGLLPPEARKGTFSFRTLGHNYRQRYGVDDAVLMTAELWEKLTGHLKPSGGEGLFDQAAEAVYTEEHEERVLSDIKPEDAIGRWWVVVDCHI